MNTRRLRTYGLVVLAAALTAGLVFMRKNTAFIQAASAGGTLVAAVFTAMAAFAAQRAATQSNLTSERAREALARTQKPTVHASILQVEAGQATGCYGPRSDRGVLDVTITWELRDGSKRVERIDALTPEPTGHNPHLPRMMHLGPWRGSEQATASKVTIDYTDPSRIMRWRFTRRFMTDEEWIDLGYSPRADSSASQTAG